MEKLMRDLYNGCYDPHNRVRVTKSLYDKEFAQWSRMVDELELSMPEEYQKKIGRLVEKTAQILSLRSEEDFIAGYQLGARLMIVALAEDGTLPQ